MTSKIICLLIIMTKSCVGQDYAFIDDIPIESYDHGDHEENHMDLELLPKRQGRSFSSEEDPKDFFFRSMRSSDDVDDVRNFGPYQNLPRPYFQPSVQGDDRRKKRSAADPVFTTGKEDKSLSEIIKKLGKPLEVAPLDTKKLTEKDDKAENQMALEDQKSVNGDNLLINDYIRFRRSTNENFDEKNVKSDNNGQKINPLSEKLMMEPLSDDSNRETRGATKEHWVKQVYPVRKSDELFFEDNIPSSSENVRFPRVHFVTQKFADNGPAPSELRPYEREARSRNLDRAPPRALARDLGKELGGENLYYDRRSRPYMSAIERERPYYRDEMYSRYDLRDPRDIYHLRNENYDRTRNDYTSPQKTQKRIIYYATLPEISRSPPNVDLRDRYRYERDRFDDRYLSDPYRFGKTYPKSRYEEESKTPYPVKVLTDVNVREVKKNPERRIYSEVDRNRYAYNTPTYRETDG